MSTSRQVAIAEATQRNGQHIIQRVADIVNDHGFFALPGQGKVRLFFHDDEAGYFLTVTLDPNLDPTQIEGVPESSADYEMPLSGAEGEIELREAYEACLRDEETT